LIFTDLAPGVYSIVVQDDHGCLTTSQLVLLNSILPISYDISVTDVCLPDSGFIDITNVSGGVGSYQYSVTGGSTFQSSGNFSGLFPITYNIRVQDANGCYKDSTATVGIDLPPAPSITDNNPYCDGTGV